MFGTHAANLAKLGKNSILQFSATFSCFLFFSPDFSFNVFTIFLLVLNLLLMLFLSFYLRLAFSLSLYISTRLSSHTLCFYISTYSSTRPRNQTPFTSSLLLLFYFSLKPDFSCAFVSLRVHQSRYGVFARRTRLFLYACIKAGSGCSHAERVCFNALASKPVRVVRTQYAFVSLHVYQRRFG